MEAIVDQEVLMTPLKALSAATEPSAISAASNPYSTRS